jgi:Ohr subfamily peroxiredoxin
MDVLYTAEATATGGRQGKVRSSDGVIDLELAIPTRPDGGAEGHSNPEQLFAAAYAACFQSALTLVAQREGASLGDSSVTGRVSLERDDRRGFGIGVELVVSVPGLDRQQAEDLVAQAHQVCPYSKATRGNVDVRLTVV